MTTPPFQLPKGVSENQTPDSIILAIEFRNNYALVFDYSRNHKSYGFQIWNQEGICLINHGGFTTLELAMNRAPIAMDEELEYRRQVAEQIEKDCYHEPKRDCS